jgi:uncharacterized membrane protein YfcA
MFGIGGGTVMTPALALMTSLTQHEVIGTSLAAMLLPSAAGCLTHYKLGNIVKRSVLPLAAGTAIGAVVGGKLALALPEDPLRWTFGALMCVLGGRQVVKARQMMKAAAAARSRK